MSTRDSHAYHGPADLALLFNHDELTRTEHYPALRVLLDQTMPGLYALGGVPEALGCVRVRVELPDGRVLAGAVVSSGLGRLVFRDEPA